MLEAGLGLGGVWVKHGGSNCKSAKMFSPSNEKRATEHTEVLKGKISLLELKLIGHPPPPPQERMRH